MMNLTLLLQPARFSKFPTLGANMLWTLGGNLTYAACQWGVLILLSKLGSVEMVGKFALALAVTAPIILFSNLSLRSVQATDAAGVYPFGQCLGLRTITTGAAFLLILILMGIVGYPAETMLVILMVGLAKSFESISDVIYGLLQQHEWMDKIAISMILKGLLSLLGVLAGLVIGQSIVWAVIGMAAGWVLILVGYDLPSAKLLLNMKAQGNLTLKPQWRWESLLRLAKVTLPLGLATFMISLNLNIPRYFIERNFGETQLGVFAALVYPLTAGTILMNALGQASSPRLAHHFAAGETGKFVGLIARLSAAGLVMAAAAVTAAAFFGKDLLAIIYQPEYAHYHNEFIWLAAAYGVEYTFTFMGYGMTAAHYFRIQPVIFFLTILLSLGLGFALIPAYGMIGAAMTIFGATCFRSLGMTAVNLAAIRKNSQTGNLLPVIDTNGLNG